MSRPPLEAGQAPQILSVGDAQTAISRKLPESHKNKKFYGHFLKHTVNLVNIQLDNDSSWVAEELMKYGPKALSQPELKKTTLLLLRTEYQKMAIASANATLAQVDSENLGVKVNPLSEERFLTLLHWAKTNSLIMVKNVVTLLPLWADIVPYRNPTDMQDLQRLYLNCISRPTKYKPSIPARLLAGAVASNGLAKVLEQDQLFDPVAKNLREQARASIAMAGTGFAALTEKSSMGKLKPVIDEFFQGLPEEEKTKVIHHILSGELNNFGPAVFAFDSATIEETHKALKGDTTSWKKQTVQIVTLKWPEFKKNMAVLFPQLEEKDFTAMEVIMKRALFIPEEELTPRPS